MKLEQCLYAVEIADTGSFSQAARNLYVSQPNLSHAVKQLEQEAGFSLFERTPSGVIPTARGAELIAHLRTIKREYESIQDFVQRPNHTPRLSLRVATLNASRTSGAFSAAVQRYIGSPIRFSFQNYSSIDELLPVVETCQVDFAVVGLLSPFQKSVVAKLRNHEIEYHSLGDFQIHAIFGPQNPLHREAGPVTQAQLYPYTMVQYSGMSVDPENLVANVIGLNRHVFGEVNVNTSQMFYQVLRTTGAFGLVSTTPELFARYNADPDLRIRLLADCPVTAQFGWIKQRRYPLSDIAAGLLQEIRPLFQGL